MIIATPDGKFYSETWRESDEFRERRITEISQERVEDYCNNSHDYVIYRHLSIKERLDIILNKEIAG